MIKRFFTSNRDAKKLQGLVEEINTAIQDFVVSAAISSAVDQSLTITQTQTVLVINSIQA